LVMNVRCMLLFWVVFSDLGVFGIALGLM